MQWLVVLLLISFFAGQLGAITFAPGIMVYAHDLVVLLILFYGAWSGGFVRKAKLLGPIALFLFVGALSLVTNWQNVPSEAFWKGSLYLVRWAAYAGVYVVLAGAKPVRFLSNGLFFTGLSFSLFGLLQFVLYPDLRNLMYLGWDPHYYRLFSTLLDPNFTGILLVLTIILGIHLKKPILLLALPFVALLLTYSRSSYLALIAAGAAWVVISKKWKFGLFALLFFLIAIVYLPRPGREALSLDRFDSTAARIANWSESTVKIFEKPVFGRGFNLLPYSVQAAALPLRAGAGIDNSLLFVGVTTGIVGILSFLWLLWSIARTGNAVVRISLVAILVHSVFVNSLFYPWVVLWLWLLLASQRV